MSSIAYEMTEEDAKLENVNETTKMILNCIKSGELPEMESKSSKKTFFDESEKLRLEKKSLLEMLRKNNMMIEPYPLFSSYFQKRAGLMMTGENSQLLKLLPIKYVSIYPLKWYTTFPIIQIPVRGLKCTHFEAVDFDFLLHEIETKGWNCPVCGSSLSLSSIYIDSILEKQLTYVNEKYAGKALPDILLFSKITKQYVPICSSELSTKLPLIYHEELGIEQDIRVNLLPEKVDCFVYEVMAPRIVGPLLEIPIEFRSTSKHPPKNLICISIFGRKDVNDYMFQFIKKDIHVNLEFILFRPSSLCIGTTMKQKILLMLEKMELLKYIFIVSDSQGMKEMMELKLLEKSFEKGKNISYMKPINLQDSKEEVKFKNFDTIDNFVENLKNEISIDFPSRGNPDINNLFAKAFCSSFNIDEKNASCLTAPNGFLIQSIAPTLDSKENYPILFSPILTDSSISFKVDEELSPVRKREILEIHHISIPLGTAEHLHSENYCKIFYPYKEDMLNQKTGEAQIQIVLNSNRIEDYLYPMMLCDCVVMIMSSEKWTLLEQLLELKRCNPAIYTKELLLFFKDKSEFEKLSKMFESDCKQLKDKRKDWYRIQTNFIWAFVDPFNNNIKDSLKKNIKFWIENLSTIHFSTSTFYHKETQSLTACLQSVFQGLKHYSSHIIKEGTTYDVKNFSLIIRQFQK